jgi:hypothetical protein
MDVKQLEELAATFNQISRVNPLARATWDSRWLVNSQKSGAAGNDLKLLCIKAARAKGYSGPDPLAHWLDFIKECGFNYFETKNGSVSNGGDGVVHRADTGEISNLADACARGCLALLSAIVHDNKDEATETIKTRAFKKLSNPQTSPTMSADEVMLVLGRGKSWVYDNVPKIKAGRFSTAAVHELLQSSPD